MKLSDIKLEPRSLQTGISMYVEGSYYLTYLTYSDCLIDLAYHFSVDELERLASHFKDTNKALPPLKYRAVCSELFLPTDSIYRYAFFADSLQEIISKFESLELRAIKYPDKFCFDVQGIGIHLFDPQTQKYKLWLGSQKPSSISDILMQARNEHKFIPNCMIDEAALLDNFDVFISHKSCDYKAAKSVYDFLIQNKKKPFLSECSLPAIANADYAFEIDNALSKSRHLVVVATSVDNIMSGWVRYEWSSFANEIRSGRKTGNIVTINCGIKIEELPYLLRQYEVVDVNDLQSLTSFLI